jgi:UDP-N-acetylglucosamine 2-epimerase
VKIVTVVGARPQFIKAAPVSRALREGGHQELLVHTGQHYDYGMSQVFFDELEIPEPAANLGVGSASHGLQTAEMLARLDPILLAERPDCVLVYGDTNSTLAGALAACKLGIPVAHVEAGLRSYNRAMPEEHNRVLTDHCADLLLCPTQTAVDTLHAEGLGARAHLVGDTMYDAVLRFADLARERSGILGMLELEPRSYVLATVHRAYNTDDGDTLRSILAAFAALEQPVVFPVHPRTRQRIDQLNGAASFISSGNVRLIDPIAYLDMLQLEQNARVVLTDSGGVQKEAFYFGVPCVTLRPETEWVETVQSGWNVVAGTATTNIVRAVAETIWPTTAPPHLFGDGHAAERIVATLEQHRVG